MSDPAPIDQNTLGPFHSPSGGISGMRVGFFIALGIASVLALTQAVFIAFGIKGDLTAIIGTFLGSAFVGKAGQSFAEK